MFRVRNTSRTIPGPLCMWNALCSDVTIPAASWPRCCSSSSPSYSSFLTGVFATTPRMPHICAIPPDSSVLQALRQARGHIEPQREYRGLERPRQRRVAPERFARKRRQACKQDHDENDDQPSYQAENRPQRAIRRSQTRCADGRRKREPGDPTDNQHHAEHDQEAYQRAQQRTQAFREEAGYVASEKRRQYEPADPHSERDHLARQAVEQADRDRHDQDDQYAKIEPRHRCATCPTSRPRDLSRSRALSAASRLAKGPARTRVCSPCWLLTPSV